MIVCVCVCVCVCVLCVAASGRAISKGMIQYNIYTYKHTRTHCSCKD